MTFSKTRDLQRTRERLGKIAFVFDNLFSIPGTGLRVGLDGIIGLVPGLGDAAGALISSYLLYAAARSGASFSLLLRMTFNIGIEWLVGTIPFLGDIFDFGWKSNARNYRLFVAYLDNPQKARFSNRLFAAMVIVILAGLTIAGAYTGVLIMQRIAQNLW